MDKLWRFALVGEADQSGGIDGHVYIYRFTHKRTGVERQARVVVSRRAIQTSMIPRFGRKQARAAAALIASQATIPEGGLWYPTDHGVEHSATSLTLTA